MNIQLKKVSHNERLSEETNCFSADVWIDGVKAGEVSNRGHGGPDDFYPYSLQERLDAYGATLPPEVTSYGTFPQDAETLIGELLTDWLVRRDLTKALQKRCLYVQDGAIYQTKIYAKDMLPTCVAHFVKQGKTVLNTLAPDEALKLYKQFG